MQNSPKWLFAESESQIDRIRLIQMLNSLAEGFLAVGEDGVIEFGNGSALNLLDANQLQGKNLSEQLRLFTAASEPTDALSLFKSQTGSFVTQDYYLKNNQGSLTRLRLSISPVHRSEANSSGGFTVLFAPAQ